MLMFTKKWSTFARFDLTKHARTEVPGHLRAPPSPESPIKRAPRQAPAPFASVLMLKIAKSMRFNIQGEDSLQRRRQSTWCFLNGIGYLTPVREL